MDEKKKLIVIGALTVVMLGIGAFQIVKGSSHAPAAAPAAVATTAASASNSNATSTTNKDDSQAAQQANDLVKGSYPAHDPFKPLVDANAVPASQVAAQNNLQTPPASKLVRAPKGEAFPAFPISKEGQLPGASAQGGVTAPIKPPAPEYGYALAGIIMGRKPAAVFVDSQGGQHLVQLGGSLDGDTRLVDLDRGHAVLRVKDQTKTLTLGGGNSSAK
jgi:hypothetical protein